MTKFTRPLFLLMLAANFAPVAVAHEGHNHGAPAQQQVQDLAPRAAMANELFNLLAVLDGSNLNLYLDRLADNSPVADAQIDVEGEGLQLSAKMQSTGIYLVQSPKLANPGTQHFTLTLTVGDSLDIFPLSLEVPAERKPYSEAPRQLPDATLLVPKSAQYALGLRTAKAEAGQFQRSLSLNGRVLPDPNASAIVQAVQGGRIEPGANGLPLLGQRVEKGQVLAYLQPTASVIDIGNRQADLAELDGLEAIAERRLNRYTQLQRETPKQDLEDTRIELAAIRKRKAVLEASLNRETLVAPLAGVISKVNASIGQIVDEHEIAFEIIDPTRLMVEALAYEPLPDAGLGHAEANLGGQVLKLEFVSLSPELRDLARPVLLRILPSESANAPSPAIGQPLKVLAQTQSALPGIKVPSTALSRNSANQPVVWVQDAPERFSQRLVQAQPLDGKHHLVTDGLKGGETLATQAVAAFSQVR